MRALLTISLVALLGIAAGCPKRFDPSTTPAVPTSGNAAARARFEEARARFERDDWQAAQDFQQIARDFPQDPIATHATLFAGMSSYRGGQYAEAALALGPLVDDPKADEEVRRRARFFLGLSYAYTGKGREALGLLQPFEGKLAEGEEEGELYAALAESAAGVGEGEAALRYYDAFWERARPAERVYIAGKVRVLVDGLSPEAAQRAYGSANKDRVAAAYLGLRLAMAARASGRSDDAAEILDDTASARASAGLQEGSRADVSDPQLVGALLPLSGNNGPVGELALRGLALASGTYDRTPASGVRADGRPAPFVVSVRDSAGATGGAAGGVDELAQKGVVAIVGPMEREGAADAVARSEALGVPLVTLDFASAGLGVGSPHVFGVVLSVEDRARALARYAVSKGARTFATLGPESAYATRAIAAFTEEAQRLSATVVAKATYAKDAKTFVEPVKQLAGKPFDALFIPDTANNLELVAPQLAVANLRVAPFGAPRPAKGRGRNIVLLSTAEFLGSVFLQRGSGRYAEGAILAPGFFPDEQDPRIGPYVTRFRAVYGKDPNYYDAYAYDAALVVRAAVEAGARDRDALAAAMAAGAVPGLSGDVRFDPSRHRSDPGVLFTVTTMMAPGATAPSYTIRAIR